MYVRIYTRTSVPILQYVWPYIYRADDIRMASQRRYCMGYVYTNVGNIHRCCPYNFTQCTQILPIQWVMGNIHGRFFMGNTAPEASWRWVFDPLPLFCLICTINPNNGYCGLVPEHAPGPSSQVLPGCRVRHPLGSKKVLVRSVYFAHRPRYFMGNIYTNIQCILFFLYRKMTCKDKASYTIPPKSDIILAIYTHTMYVYVDVCVYVYMYKWYGSSTQSHKSCHI